jgi:hypothetical protein
LLSYPSDSAFETPTADSDDATSVDAVRTVVLEDGAGGGDAIVQRLRTLGHDASLGPQVNDPAFPLFPLDEVEVVLLSQAPEDEPVTEAPSSRLVEAALAGVGIIRTGLAARISATTGEPSTLDQSIPVTDAPETTPASTRTVAAPDHPIASESPPFWVVRERSGAVRQVFVNATFAEADGPISADLDHLLDQAVRWAAAAK